MSAAKIRAPHAFNASRSFVISVFIHEHSLSTRVLGVKSGEQGDKSVSLVRVVPKPSHAVCFWSWANSQNTRVCVSEQSGVQTSARRVSQNTRVWRVNKGKERGGLAPAPRSLSSVLHASRTVCHSTYLPRDTLRRYYYRTQVAANYMCYYGPRKFFHLRSHHLRRVQTVESRMGKHPDRRPRGSVCAPVTTPACAVPAEILGGGVNSVSSTHLSCDGMNLSRS